MQSNDQQQVFPFLADDPLYRREIREEKIVSQLSTALQPVLRHRMTDIIHDMAKAGFKEKLDVLVADAIKGAMQDCQAKFHDIRLFLELLALRCPDCHDPADWWKRDAEPDEDEDI